MMETTKMVKNSLFSGCLTVIFLCLVALFDILVGSANASLVNGQNWADDVTTWSGAVQNYAGTVMGVDTISWLTGPSDSDVDKNAYAWDEVDNDYVAGWRSSGSASITMYFESGLGDIVGNDLVIHLYSGPNADASVWASSDNISFTEIGSIGGGTSGYFRDDVFVFDGAIDRVHYIRVDRQASGSKTGMFFDSFASVPEPTVMVLLGFGGLGLLSCRNRAQNKCGKQT